MPFVPQTASFGETLLVGLYLVALFAEFARLSFELLVLYSFRETRALQELTPDQIAVVIPCHNSESVICETLNALPHQYTVYCVVNNSSDGTARILGNYHTGERDIRIIDVTYPQRSKTRAVVVGTVAAQQDGFTHVLQVDDDVTWPSGVGAIAVYDPAAPVTALAVLPYRTGNLMQGFQGLEYISVHLNKTVQALFGKNVTWASGAGAIYRCDTLLQTLKLHDGDFIGEDVQCSYLHHYLGYRIDAVSDCVIYTQVPANLRDWWKQRCHCWDISLMFYHTDLLLKVLFAPIGRGAGGWMRLMTFYRLYDAVSVIVKVTLPILLFVNFQLFLTFVALSYASVAIKFPSHLYLFGLRKLQITPKLALGFFLYPLYEYLIWVSRLAALPRAVALIGRGRSLLGDFGDRCSGRFKEIKRPYRLVHMDL